MCDMSGCAWGERGWFVVVCVVVGILGHSQHNHFDEGDDGLEACFTVYVCNCVYDLHLRLDAMEILHQFAI